MRAGEINAAIIAGGKPYKFVSSFKDDRFHLVTVDYARGSRKAAADAEKEALFKQFQSWEAEQSAGVQARPAQAPQR